MLQQCPNLQQEIKNVTHQLTLAREMLSQFIEEPEKKSAVKIRGIMQIAEKETQEILLQAPDKLESAVLELLQEWNHKNGEMYGKFSVHINQNFRAEVTTDDMNWNSTYRSEYLPKIIDQIDSLLLSAEVSEAPNLKVSKALVSKSSSFSAPALSSCQEVIHHGRGKLDLPVLNYSAAEPHLGIIIISSATEASVPQLEEAKKISLPHVTSCNFQNLQRLVDCNILADELHLPSLQICKHLDHKGTKLLDCPLLEYADSSGTMGDGSLTTWAETVLLPKLKEGGKLRLIHATTLDAESLIRLQVFEALQLIEVDLPLLEKITHDFICPKALKVNLAWLDVVKKNLILSSAIDIHCKQLVACGLLDISSFEGKMEEAFPFMRMIGPGIPNRDDVVMIVKDQQMKQKVELWAKRDHVLINGKIEVAKS
jgi:hypothetical protein